MAYLDKETLGENRGGQGLYVIWSIHRRLVLYHIGSMDVFEPAQYELNELNRIENYVARSHRYRSCNEWKHCLLSALSGCNERLNTQ
jgi:hypothetical protein